MKRPPLGSVLGRVFQRSGRMWGPIRDCGKPGVKLPSGWTAVAEDSCGNYFLWSKSRGVAFWDHETSEIETLASDWDAFAAGCAEPPPVDVNPLDVISVWIDPEFAAKHGLELPPHQRKKP
jgi:hypothetical protein